MHFNAPPGWPSPPAGFSPAPGWQPDPSWPAAPAGWVFWLPDIEGVAPRPPLTRLAKRVGIAAMATAVVLAVVAMVFIAVRVGPSVRTSLLSSTPTTPVDEHMHLSSGRYVIYERTGGSTRVGEVSVSENASVSISPDDVVVIGPGGGAVQATRYTSNTTITRGGKIFTAAVLFHATASGTYDIRVSAPQPRQIIVSADLGSTFHAILGWLPVLFGSLVLLVGGILLLLNGPRQGGSPSTSGGSADGHP